MLLLDKRVRAKPATTRFPPSHPPRLLKTRREPRHHYNLSDAHRNQYHNVNLRCLQRPNQSFRESPPRTRESPLPSPPLRLSLPADPLLGTIQCPLNSPDFPPVSESDHLLSRCYCYLCTCEEHFCPNKKRHRRTFFEEGERNNIEQVEFLNKRLEFLTVTAPLPKPMTGTSTDSRRYRMASQLTGWEEGSEAQRIRGRVRRSNETWDSLNKTDALVASMREDTPENKARLPELRHMTVSVRKNDREWSTAGVLKNKRLQVSTG